MLTIKDYLLGLPEPYRSQAVDYARRDETLFKRSSQENISNLCQAMFHAFDWHCSHEGVTYWHKVSIMASESKFKISQIVFELIKIMKSCQIKLEPIHKVKNTGSFTLEKAIKSAIVNAGYLEEVFHQSDEDEVLAEYNDNFEYFKKIGY